MIALVWRHHFDVHHIGHVVELRIAVAGEQNLTIEDELQFSANRIRDHLRLAGRFGEQWRGKRWNVLHVIQVHLDPLSACERFDLDLADTF